MPALDDDREELLAQELAKGATQALAWVNAGYSAKNSNVAAVNCNKLLKKKAEIRQRVDELRAMLRNNELETKFAGDVDSLTSMYLEDRKLAREMGQVSASISALNGIAKLHGLGSESVRNTHEAGDSLKDMLDRISQMQRLAK